MTCICIRTARPEDRELLYEMQSLSMRILAAGHYSTDQIESFLWHVGTMDGFLLREGTYLVAEVDGALVGAGGWSQRTPSYAGAIGTQNRLSPSAWVRSVFVHPNWARKGIARRIMAMSEAGALDAGHVSVELTATLSGVPLYRALGYVAVGDTALHLPDGLAFPLVRMHKSLDPWAKAASA